MPGLTPAQQALLDGGSGTSTAPTRSVLEWIPDPNNPQNLVAWMLDPVTGQGSPATGPKGEPITKASPPAAKEAPVLAGDGNYYQRNPDGSYSPVQGLPGNPSKASTPNVPYVDADGIYHATGTQADADTADRIRNQKAQIANQAQGVANQSTSAQNAADKIAMSPELTALQAGQNVADMTLRGGLLPALMQNSAPTGANANMAAIYNAGPKGPGQLKQLADLPPMFNPMTIGAQVMQQGINTAQPVAQGIVQRAQANNQSYTPPASVPAASDPNAVNAAQISQFSSDQNVLRGTPMNSNLSGMGGVGTYTPPPSNYSTAGGPPNPYASAFPQNNPVGPYTPPA